MSDFKDHRDDEDVEEEDDSDYDDANEPFGLAWRAIRDRNGSFTKEEDVDNFVRKHGDVAKYAKNGTPNLLHSIIEQLTKLDIIKDLADVLPLVKRLVQTYPSLLHKTNEKNQNPIFLAFSLKKVKLFTLVEHMTKCCDDNEPAQECLKKALEMPCSTEMNKTCLHLALESRYKPTLIMKLVKLATVNALVARDSKGKTPLHYAVNYSLCSDARVEIIKCFLERDEQVVAEQKYEFPNQPVETFLDWKDNSNRSVYQEHFDSAKKHQKAEAEHSKSQEAHEISAPKALDEGKDRNAVLRTRPEHGSRLQPKEFVKPQLPSDLKAPEHEDGGRGRMRNLGKADAETTDEREMLRRQLREAEEKRLREEDAKLLESRQRAEGVGERRDQSRGRVSISLDTGRGTSSGPGRPAIPNTAIARPGNDRAPNTPLKRVATMQIEQEGTGEKSQKPSTTTKKKAKGPDKEELARNSETVLGTLKLHYMRTRPIQKATAWLYGTNPGDIQSFFDYKGLPVEIPGDLVKKTFLAMQFDEVLKYVRFPHVTVHRRPTPQDKKKAALELGRRDMEFFFDWLYSKGVKYILKLTIEEDGDAVHSDEAIKKALDKVMVEHLDWQKMDMDPEVICGISSQVENKIARTGEANSPRNKLRTLDLMWSGNNAVLRAWSEPQGLPLLHNLQAVNIIVPENVTLYDSEDWIRNKIDQFETRLNNNIAEARATKDGAHERHVSVSAYGISKIKSKMGSAVIFARGQTPSSPMIAKKVITSHEWLDCMERFARLIMPFWDKMLDNSKARLGDIQGYGARLPVMPVEEDVVVALIDDGVVSLDKDLSGRVLEGKTFDYHDDSVGQHYNSDQGHGTEMAKLILRVCPMAKIYPIRLKTYRSENDESKIDLESAALAINAALEKDAKIISMSWSIPIPMGEEHARERELFKSAIGEACRRRRLMFCSSPDIGQFTSDTYPSVIERGSLFRIGAAHDDGTPFSYAGRDVDYIFPGVKVGSQAPPGGREPPRDITGSSVATALAAGLAATIIYCFKASVLAYKVARAHKNVPDTLPSDPFIEQDVRNIMEHPAMKTAFGKIGAVNDGGFIQVWDLFEPVSQLLGDPKTSHEEQVKSIVDLCSKLKDWGHGLRGASMI